MTSHNKIKILNKPSRKWLWIVSIIMSLVGGILLIGIPGALLVGLVGWLLEFTGLGMIHLSGDEAWPTVIMLSLLWPFLLLPVSSWMNRKFPKVQSGLHWFLIIIISLMITVFAIFVWFSIQNHF